MGWPNIDPAATWPYGLGGVVTGFVATLMLSGGEAPRQIVADAMKWGAPPIVRPQPEVASPAVPVVPKTAVVAPAAASAAKPATVQSEATAPGSASATPSGDDRPPYPSPLMPCRRLANSYHQSMSGPDGPPGYRCRQLRAGN